MWTQAQKNYALRRLLLFTIGLPTIFALIFIVEILLGYKLEDIITFGVDHTNQTHTYILTGTVFIGGAFFVVYVAPKINRFVDKVIPYDEHEE